MENTQRIDHLQILFAGTIGMGVLVIALILFVIKFQKRKIQEQEERRKLIETNQKKVLVAILQTQEAERKRIARDLHDELGSALAVAKLNLGNISLPPSEDSNQEIVKETYSILEETLRNIRRISKDLHPVLLEKYGLPEAIKSLGKKCSSANLFVQVKIGQEVLRLEAYEELNIFRIVQELVNNAIKHSQANRIELEFALNQDQLVFTYQDNGIGFNQKNQQEINPQNVGLGLITIETRVRILKGKWELVSRSGQGTMATFYFPLKIA